MLHHAKVLISLFLGILAFSEKPLAESLVEGKRLTLIAEISVVNETDTPVIGYVHRVAIPVQGHFQQILLEIRHDEVLTFGRKPFIDAAGDYVELEWNIPANTSSVKKVYFDLLVTPYAMPDNSAAENLRPEQGAPSEIYIQPAKFIESDSVEIKRLAQGIMRKFPDEESRLRAAFLMPQKLLDYQRQSTRGALYALKERKGDCTEYAALFVALSRAMGYPARITSDFLFTENRSFSQPNHHAAEVYLNGRWIPVDPNLALDPEFGYGFGIGSDTKIVLNRNSTWVWSNLWPKGIKSRRGKVDVSMHWRIVESGGINDV